jgi:hypothetical protein
MEKKGARLFQASEETRDYDWNIVELETRRQLRLKVNELLRLVNDPTLTTSEMQQHLLYNKARFGKQLATQLVHSLHLAAHAIERGCLDHTAPAHVRQQATVSPGAALRVAGPGRYGRNPRNVGRAPPGTIVRDQLNTL